MSKSILGFTIDSNDIVRTDLRWLKSNNIDESNMVPKKDTQFISSNLIVMIDHDFMEI